MKPEVLPPCKTSIYQFGGSMSILEGVPDVATELNDSLIVFFFRRVMGDKMRNEKRHSKTGEKKNVTSEFTNNEKHCHVFMYQS